MKKIIAAADPLEFEEKQLLHFDAVARMLNSKPVVVFLRKQIENIIPAGAFPEVPFVYDAGSFTEQMEKEQERIDEKVKLFHSICSDKKIDAILHRHNGIPVEDIVKESRFSDLLMIHADTTLSAIPGFDPPRFVRNVLQECECPVLVLPTEPKPIDEIVFTYNGSFSSMYAIRQFTSLFVNDFANKKITILVVDEKSSASVPEEDILWEYLDFHYKNYQVKFSEGDPSFAIMDYAMAHPGALVTLGAYGRSKLSLFFHPSDAKRALHYANTHFFITHP